MCWSGQACAGWIWVSPVGEKSRRKAPGPEALSVQEKAPGPEALSVQEKAPGPEALSVQEKSPGPEALSVQEKAPGPEALSVQEKVRAKPCRGLLPKSVCLTSSLQELKAHTEGRGGAEEGRGRGKREEERLMGGREGLEGEKESRRWKAMRKGRLRVLNSLLPLTASTDKLLCN